ncbi:MAG: hypothetical protein J6Y61_00895 [Bacteroidales bacterium]|nr:hypothetical protein [Bacteroidales bacterium]
MKKRILLIIAFALLAFASCSYKHYTYLRAAEERELFSPAQQEEYDAFIWRAERKDRDALPSSFRTCQSELRVRSAVSGYDPEFKPSTKGLADLKVSASSDFSAKELDALVAEIRKLHSGPITIVDLRSETHGLLNGDHLSLYGQENWDNMGLTHEQIIENEKRIIHGLVGKEIETGGTSRNGRTTKMTVTSAETEEELCARRGVGYLRLTVLDHCFADPRSIDDFISFVQTLPEDTWLHIHCQAGMGRTNMFLVFYDFLRNTDVPVKDVVYRHFMQGGNFQLYDGEKEDEAEWKIPLAKEKVEMIPLVHEYIKEQKPKGFKVPWSQWKTKFKS